MCARVSLSNIIVAYPLTEIDKVYALSDVTVEISAGEFVVVIGPNGSGKSTLLKVISGEVEPDHGQIAVGDEKRLSVAGDTLAGRVSHVFQDPSRGSCPHLTIAEHIALVARNGSGYGWRLPPARPPEPIMAELEKIGLADRLHQPAGTLSGGERQRLTVFLAWLRNPDVMLLDEPAASLDPERAEQCMATITDLIGRKRITTILVTHNLETALKVGDRLLCLDRGKVIRDLATAEKAKVKIEDLRKLYATV